MNRKQNRLITKSIEILLSVFLVFMASVSSAQPDTIYISTGEILYGEAKSFDRNVLEFDTEYADSEFKIDWDEVKGFATSTVLTIYMTDGTRITGAVRFDQNEKRMVAINSEEKVTSVSLDNIVWFISHEKNFLQRLKISIDGGYSYSKSSESQQFSSTAKVSYTEKEWYIGADFSRIGTRFQDAEPASRTNASGNFIYNITNHVFTLVGLELLENSSQSLKLRTTSKVGAGYFFKRSNALFFYSGIGIANNHENYGGDTPVEGNSFEGMGIMEFDAFNIGDFSFRTKMIVYPSFNHHGRIRFNGDVSLKYDLPLDFYIKFSYTHNFDSKPLIDISQNDYVILTNIGWEWN